MVDTLDMTGRKDPVEQALAGGRSLWDDAKRRLFNNKAAVISMWVLGVMFFLAVFGPMLWVHSYKTISAQTELAPTFENWHLLGTDEQGRDLVARNLLGLRISLAVGLVATLVSLIIGVTWGAIAGFVGGRVDNIMMRFVDVLYAMPFIFFVILLLTVFGRNIILIFAAIGAVEWLTMSRIVRGQTLAIKGKDDHGRKLPVFPRPRRERATDLPRRAHFERRERDAGQALPAHGAGHPDGGHAALPQFHR